MEVGIVGGAPGEAPSVLSSTDTNVGQYDEGDVRESMRVLPGWIQPGLTFLTGKPLRGESAPRGRTRLTQCVSASSFLLGGVASAASLLVLAPRLGPWAVAVVPALSVSWLVAVNGMRKLQTVILHHCVHGMFCGCEDTERKIADAVSSVLLTQSYRSYKHDHVTGHHSMELATFSDPDLRFLLYLGFRTGVPKAQNWRHLRRVLFSPRFHGCFMRIRLVQNFAPGGAPPARRALAAGIQGTILVGVTALSLGTGSLMPVWLYTGAWLVPNLLGLQVSALLQFLTEHRWLTIHTMDPAVPYRVRLARLTAARFCGERVPPAGLPRRRAIWAWAVWAFRMLFVHLPARVGVLAGDLCVHDWHHRHGRDSNWPISFHARQRAVEHRKPGEEPYREVWGLAAAIEGIFEDFESMPSLPENWASMSIKELAEAFGAM